MLKNVFWSTNPYCAAIVNTKEHLLSLFFPVILSQKSFILYEESGKEYSKKRLFGSRCFGEQYKSSIIAHLSHNPSLIKGLNNHLCQQHGNEIETSFADLGVSYSGLSGKTAADFGSGKPFITYLNVYSNNVIDETSYQYVRMGNNEKQSIVRYGDVLFTLSSETPEEVGIGSVYLGNQEVYLNSFCFGIHITNTQKSFSPYLSYYISTTQFRKFIYPFAQGSTRFNLCKADFEKATIKLPTLENQKRIYKALKSLSDKIMVEKATLEQYSRQKQYLLRQMFI